MPKKGEVRLSTNLRHMREALIWLQIQERATPEPVRTVLAGDAQQIEKSRKTLITFKKRLHKAQYRKRRCGTDSVTLNIPKIEISAFVRSQEAHFIRLALTNRCFRRLALSDDIVRSIKPRGRPKLTNTQRSKRLSKNYHIGDRQKPRLRKAEKSAKRDAEWLRGLRERGETILTDSVGRPKA